MVSINSNCIGCGTCAAIAPTIFKVEGIPAEVIKEPATAEEQTLTQQAIEMCPVQAISDTPAKMAA